MGVDAGPVAIDGRGSAALTFDLDVVDEGTVEVTCSIGEVSASTWL